MKRRNFIEKGSLGLAGITLFSPSLSIAAPAFLKSSKRNEVVLHTFSSSGPLQHSSNNYFIETSDGVFVVDAQWTLSEARKSLLFLRQKTRKPIIGMLITHDHTDHYGGSQVFVDETGNNLPVYASAITQLSIKNDAWGFQSNRKKNFGNDFPDNPVVPNRVVHNGDKIDLGGISLKVIEKPNNEATSTTLVYIEELNSLITGDIVYDKTYAIFREGLSGIENWKQQLEDLRLNFSRTDFHPGHGGKREGKSIINEQIEFLLAFRDPVLKALDTYGEVPLSVKNRMMNNIIEGFPEHQTIIGLTKEQVIDQSIKWLSSELDRR